MLIQRGNLHLRFGFYFLFPIDLPIFYVFQSQVVLYLNPSFLLQIVALYQQLQDFEQKIFGNIENNDPTLPVFSSSSVAPAFNFSFEKPNDRAALPAFGNAGTTSIFTSPTSEIPQQFTFGAANVQNNGAFPPG